MHRENFHHNCLLLGYGSTLSAIVAGCKKYFITQEHLVFQINKYRLLLSGHLLGNFLSFHFQVFFHVQLGTRAHSDYLYKSFTF